jgi:hypothetical protein
MNAIKNFTETQSLRVELATGSTPGADVALIQDAGSMYFQFCMNSVQAREMAQRLIEASDKVDRLKAAREARDAARSELAA